MFLQTRHFFAGILVLSCLLPSSSLLARQAGSKTEFQILSEKFDFVAGTYEGTLTVHGETNYKARLTVLVPEIIDTVYVPERQLITKIALVGRLSFCMLDAANCFDTAP